VARASASAAMMSLLSRVSGVALTIASQDDDWRRHGLVWARLPCRRRRRQPPAKVSRNRGPRSAGVPRNTACSDGRRCARLVGGGGTLRCGASAGAASIAESGGQWKAVAMGGLDNKVAIVTGATSGLGGATALEMARDACLAVAGWREDRGRAVAQAITDSGGQVDVRSEPTSPCAATSRRWSRRRCDASAASTAP
jgi:hypothetical protein